MLNDLDSSVQLCTGSGSELVLVEPTADALTACWSKVSQSDPHQTSDHYLGHLFRMIDSTR